MTEKKIQHQILNWCREQGLKVYATANGQHLTTWSAIRERGMMGKGLPDLVIFIPSHRSKLGKTLLLFLELKTEKGRATKEQKEFIALANSIKADVFGRVCCGYDKAIEYIQPFLCEKPPIPQGQELEEFINNL